MTNSRDSLFRTLRQLVPQRPLRFGEAVRIVELQASRFRELLGLTGDELPDDAIAGLPRVTVSHELHLPVSGLTQWHNGRWILASNALEPWTRQRFSIAHELFHALNHTTRQWLHPNNDRRGEQLGNVNPIWPHCDGLKWPHLLARCGCSRHERTLCVTG